MSHTYADIDQFKKFLIDGGDASWSGSDATILTFLEGASRRVDGWCARSQFGSGFGPRVGTNLYGWPGGSCLDLRDDLLTITSVTAHDTYGDVGRTLTDGTDFIKTPAGVSPYLELELLYGGTNVWGGAQAGNAIIGTWGYSNETAALGTVTVASGSATSAVISGGIAYAGMTLAVGSEQMYVTASSGTVAGGTATVVRSVNGSGTATGTAAASVYRYPREVVSATLQIAQRRFRSAQAGVQGDFGGGGLPIIGHRDNEYSILRATVPHLKRWSAG